MPVAASPSYHGYDVTNYYRVNPEYGTNDDFKRLTADYSATEKAALFHDTATRIYRLA
jgi:maltooligosyltrehalose synthase